MPVACCFLCGASFGVSASLNRHLKEVHNHEIVQKEKCSQCEYVGKHRNLLNHISIVHGDKFNCEMCDKSFQRRFFAVRNGCDKLLYTFIEYEHNLYLKL